MLFNEHSTHSSEFDGFDPLELPFGDSKLPKSPKLTIRLTKVALKLELLEEISWIEGGLRGAIRTASLHLKECYEIEAGVERWKIILLQNEFIKHLADDLFNDEIQTALTQPELRVKVLDRLKELALFGRPARNKSELLDLLDITKLNFALCPVNSMEEKYLRLFGISVAHLAMLYTVAKGNDSPETPIAMLGDMKAYLESIEGKTNLLGAIQDLSGD